MRNSYYIPDPIELMEARIDHWTESFVDEYTCMGCGKKVDYTLFCPSPIGDGPALCAECCGVDIEKELLWKDD